MINSLSDVPWTALHSPALAGSAVLQILPQRRGDAALPTHAPRQRTDAAASTNSRPTTPSQHVKQRQNQGHPSNKYSRTILTYATD